MKRASIAIAACAGAILISGPAGYAAKPDPPTDNGSRIAAKACNAEKKADKAAFKANWGKHAMRECKRAFGGELADEARNAAQECRDERDADPAAFSDQYGTNANGKNAFGKCVSTKVHEDQGPPTP